MGAERFTTCRKAAEAREVDAAVTTRIDAVVIADLASSRALDAEWKTDAGANVRSATADGRRAARRSVRLPASVIASTNAPRLSAPRIISNRDDRPLSHSDALDAEHASGRFADSVRHDFLHASGFLVLGAMVAAAANTFVPRAVLETVAGQAVVGVLTLAAFAFVVALCSESDAFVPASLTAFLRHGQAGLPGRGACHGRQARRDGCRVLRGAFASRFVPVFVGTAIAMASLVGWWLL